VFEVRRSIMFGLVGLVVVGVGAGTAVALTGDDPKTVSLKVDDQQSSVKTRAHTVEGVLSSRKLVVAQHDVIAPAVNTKIRNGTEIVLKRGRLLHLTIDGVERDVWTTAPTVAEALAELGYSTDDFSSVSRDKRLPLSPTDIELRTPKQVRVLHDGRNDSVTTTAAHCRAVAHRSPYHRERGRSVVDAGELEDHQRLRHPAAAGRDEDSR
jgi:uncharacterized protein YabE (DUF348 family)